MTKSYIIGLDLGINNVGYSIIDEESEKIIKKGVRLFTSANNATDRRISRDTRRRLKRKDNRINEVLKIFSTIDFPYNNTIDDKLLEKRIKGLKEQVNKQEIVNIVCYFMGHRGYIPFGAEERNLIDLNGLLPCEYYQTLYNETGKYRALEEVVNHSDLVKELELIINEQIKYYPELLSIKEQVFQIFNRKRKFWEGPGSTTSLTPYGRFQTEKDVLEYEKLKKEGKEKFLFEDLIGHCKIYINEKCAPKSNFYAEIFNLINDFINIEIINEENIKKQDYLELKKTLKSQKYKLTSLAITDIIKYCVDFEGKSLSYTKVLKEVLGLTKDDITGYRVKKDSTPDFSLMNFYRIIKNLYNEKQLDFKWLTENDYQNYNYLIQILAVAPGIVEIKTMLANIHDFSDEELEIIKIIQEKLKKASGLQYHSLSEKALKRAIKDMLSLNMNFMQVSQKLDYDKETREYKLKLYGNGEGTLLMNSQFIDDIVASPQVKKTLRQSIRIINAIIKEMKSYPSIIAIESAKEMNGQEKRKELDYEQKLNEERRKKAKDILDNLGNDKLVTDNMIERFMLFEEINGQCPYCNKPIDINDVLNNSAEVEHILPFSQSKDDSFENKTISCRDCNSKKGNKTPYNFMNKDEFKEFTSRILKLKISDKKRSNFLFSEDLNKYKIRFINRNLRDTAYATKELVSQVKLFNEYLKANLNDTEIMTLATPGQLTNKIRENWNLEKNRDIGKFHHAVDASIVAGIATTKLGKLITEMQNDPKFYIFNNKFDDELINLILNLNIPKYKDEICKIKSDDDILISMQVNKDNNKELSNANISTFVKKEDQYYIIEQISNIYSPDLIRNEKKKLDSLFDENDNKYILLCQEQNPKLFNYLKNIYLQYQQDNTNPFLNYCLELLNDNEKFDEKKHGLYTPSKNNKGVFIKRLRYMRPTSEPFLLEKENINKKEDKLIGLDSVSMYCTRLYWDNDKQKLIFMPVYMPAYNQKTKTINEQHPIYQKFYNKYLKDKNVKFIANLFNGNLVEIHKPNGDVFTQYISGYHKTNNIIECKNLTEKSGSRIASKDKIIIYDVDVLGNKKKRLTWPED